MSITFELADIDDGDPLPEIHGPNRPMLWHQMLQRFPTAVIAGGAVRDHFLGVEPKDIDIFISSSDYWTVPVEFQPIGGDRQPGSERAEEYLAVPHIDIVTRANWCGWQVDMIGLKMDSVFDLLCSFDFGVTRSAFCLEHGLIDTAIAQADRKNRQVTLLIDDRPERARARFDRFNERMGGGWEFVR